LAELKLYMMMIMKFDFEVLFKKLAEDYCNGRFENLQFFVKQKINQLLKNKTTADELYKFFGIENSDKNSKKLLIKKVIKLVEGLCL